MRPHVSIRVVHQRGRIQRRVAYHPEPLLALLPGASIRETAAALGVCRRQVDRMRAGMTMTERTADRCATALGLHLSSIW